MTSPPPPAPRLPSLVQTWRYVRKPLPFLDACDRDLGPVFRLRLVGSGDWIFLSRPEDLRAMFTGDPAGLHAGEANTSIFGPLTGHRSAFGLDEEAHLARRRLLLQPLHGDRMHEYTEAMRDLTLDRLSAWPDDRPFPLHPQMQEITLQVILRTIFGLEVGERTARLAHLLARLANDGAGSALLLAPTLQVDLGRWSPWGNVVRIVRETDRALAAEIATRRAAPYDPARRDILSLLLAARDDAGRPLSDGELRDELVTMLLAGHETTGTALAWAFERLLSHPDAMSRATAEVDSVLAGGPLERAHVPRLEYLDAAIKESLRTRPIMPVGGARKVRHPFPVGDYIAPVGSTLTNCMYLLFKRPEIYPEPEVFRPERFLGRQPDPYAWTPFGGGVRRCLGMAFALYEMKVVIATLLARVRLRLEHQPVAPVRRGFFLTPEGGPLVRVCERRN